MNDMITNFYMVQFFEPINGEKEFYFRTLSAIYDQFTPNAIGLTMTTLQNHPPKEKEPRSTRTCVIFQKKMFHSKK